MIKSFREKKKKKPSAPPHPPVCQNKLMCDRLFWLVWPNENKNII